MEWNDLERLLASDDADATGTLTEALVRLDDRSRRALSPPLTKYARNWWRDFETAPAFNPGQGVPDFVVRRYEAEVARLEMMRLAVVGTTTGAAAVATWLDREAKRYFSAWRNFPDEKEEIEGRQQAERLSRVLATRDDAWVLDLFDSLASRLRNAARDEWQSFVITKVAELGIEPPITGDFLDCWIRRYINHSKVTYAERLERLRADPLLHRMLDGLFALDGLGRHFEIYLWTDYSKRALPTYLESLLEHGDVDRGFLIDGCLRRLLRGGRTGDVSPYRKLLVDLAVTPAEAAERARDYAALLPDAASAVAGVAQKALRAADEAGLLDGELIAEACRRVLFRPEKKLALDQLSWLDKAIRRHPDAAADLVAALGIAFGHASPDVQSRAVKLTLANTAHLTEPARADLESRAHQLPSDQRERLTGLFDLAADADAPPPPELAAPPPRPLPEPIASVAELAERIAGLRTLLDTDPHGENVDPTAIEPVLAALAAFSHSDRPGLAAALEPVFAELRFIDPRWYHGFDSRLLDGVLYAAARAIGRACPPEIDADILYGRTVPAEHLTQEWLTWGSRWRKGLARMSGPERILAHRLVEIALAVADRPVPELVATPTDAIGRLDTSVLIERLRRAESEGRQPWEFDLQQALLRLPEDATDAEVARADELTSPAGRRLAAWLSGRSRPELTVTERSASFHDKYDRDGETVAPLIKVSIKRAEPDRDEPGTRLVDQLRLSFPQRVFEADMVVRDPDWPRCWAAVWPSRRDVLAAHLVRSLGQGAYWELSDGSVRNNPFYLSVLPDLAEADGPGNPSLTTCLAYGLNVAGTGDRARVVDAILTLAARGQLDAEAVAAAVADLVLAGIGKSTRIATALGEAAEAGAAQQVWRILAAALPPLLSAETAPNRLSDLVELAVRIAETVAARGEIPAIAETASRRGSSKTVKESKRLHRYLTRP